MSTMRTRAFLILATAGLCLPLLAACADSNEEGKPDPQASPTATAERDVTAESVAAGEFVADFRQEFAKLAKDRTDATIAQNASDACGKIEGDGKDRDDLITEVSKDFTANGIKPDDTTVIQIMNLAVADACPERENNLKAVLAGP